MPTVTVIIPAYNAARDIAEALASIEGQARPDIEVIVVDDGSRDATLTEVARFSNTLDLTVIPQANAGAAAARNVGILRARGRYCAFLDADDVMLPGRLHLESQLLDAEPHLALVHTDLMTFNESGIVHQTRRAFSKPCGGMVLDKLLLDNFITTSTVMARTDKLIEAGMFPPERRISHDFELWLRMASKWPVGYIDQPLLRYRYSPGSLSNNKLETALDALGVIESFWRADPRRQASEPGLYRRSLAAHLATVGDTAFAAGKRRYAFDHLVRAARLAPSDLATWKSLVKVLLDVKRPTR